MQLKAITIKVALALLVASCQVSAPEKDPFFSQSRSKWVESAAALPLQDVYRLYKLTLSEPPPPDTILAEALGKRGRPALVLWLNGLRETGEMKYAWEFGPVVREVYYQTGFSLCDDDRELYLKVIRALSEAWDFREATSAAAMVRPHCAGAKRIAA